MITRKIKPKKVMILTAIILADNGAPWFIGGVPDERWDNEMLHLLDVLEGSDFDVVDTSVLMQNPDSGTTKP